MIFAVPKSALGSKRSSTCYKEYAKRIKSSLYFDWQNIYWNISGASKKRDPISNVKKRVYLEKSILK